MTKYTLGGLVIAGVLAFGGFAPQASAATISDLQAQIEELLKKIAELQIKNTNTHTGIQHSVCSFLSRDLVRGTSGKDVEGLQTYLRDSGFFSGTITGYFGPLTEEAVKKWQTKEQIIAAGDYISTGWGRVGAKSRARIRMWCSSVVSSKKFSATPISGSVPLSVTFSVNESLQNPNMWEDVGTHVIDFGDGTEKALQCSDANDDSKGECKGPHTVTHTYGTTGTYTAQLLYRGGYPEETRPAEGVHIGSILIKAGTSQPVACTKEYAPVCGTPKYCSTATFTSGNYPRDCRFGKTYGNRCSLDAEDADFREKGECPVPTISDTQ